MKKITILTFLTFCTIMGFAHIVLTSGTNVKISSGSFFIVNSVINSSGTIENDGTLAIKGSITNNSGGLFDSGSTGTVTFKGTSAQEITGAATVHFYGALDINNSNGVSITSTTTGANQEVHGTLAFISGKLTLNAFDLTLAGTADPTGVSVTAYIVTNGTGQLKRIVDANNILFPVGNTAYNPLILNNSGTSDTYGVMVVDNEPANASTEHMVNRSWVVTEGDAGNSNLAVTTQWNSTEELTSFDRTQCAVGLTTDAGSSYSWGDIGGAVGSDPYSHIGLGFTGVGSFAISDSYIVGSIIDLKVVLAAAWNATNDNMDKALNTAGLIPTTDPYSVGVTVNSVPTNAVDWVKVELRSSSNHATVTNTYAKFVNQDGQIIEEDGTNMKLIGAVAGSYYVAVMHRNHFGVVATSTVDISSSPVINFTTAQATAWQDGTITTNAAMKEVETGVFGLWGGDTDDNSIVSYNGAGNDRISVLNALSAVSGDVLTSVYNNNDVNMEGNVSYNGAGNDRIFILNTLDAVPGGSYSAHLP